MMPVNITLIDRRNHTFQIEIRRRVLLAFELAEREMVETASIPC